MHPMLKKRIESIRQTLKTLSIDQVVADTGLSRTLLYDFLHNRHETGYSKLIVLDEYLNKGK